MKILVTGANGYIGLRLIPTLIDAGHQVVALVRSEKRFHLPNNLEEKIQIIEGDLLDKSTLKAIPKDINAAYYLVHSMGKQSQGFRELETKCAENFTSAISQTEVEQIIYLGGLGEATSEHLASRRGVEVILGKAPAALTVLRAGIIIGSGSASFEIIRDLVEKLPVMVAPKWVDSHCQPIAISDVLYYLRAVLANPSCYRKTLDIGGPDLLTYRQMMEQLAEIRGLKRWIFKVPVLTPRLSSYWLFFITSTSFSIAKALVESLKVDAVCRDHTIKKLIPHHDMSYREAVEKAFAKIDQNSVLSSWKDALVVSALPASLQNFIEVPHHGCFHDVKRSPIKTDKKRVIDKLWAIGGKRGWYTLNWAWKIRGFIDRLVGGVGLRRGRRDQQELLSGDALDFWRVLVADKAEGHLLLYAEMRLPGEAWLGWSFEEGQLVQTATFRPKGLLGRLYWYLMSPFHLYIFKRLCREIAKGEETHG